MPITWEAMRTYFYFLEIHSLRKKTLRKSVLFLHKEFKEEGFCPLEITE